MGRTVDVPLAEPFGLALQGKTVLVTDLVKPGVYEVPSGRLVVALSGRPTAITTNKARIWVADSVGRRIRVFARDGRQVAALDSPPMVTGLAFCKGRLFAALHFSGRLAEIDPVDGTMVADMPAPAGHPLGLVCWRNRFLVTADRDSGYFYVLDPNDGTVLWRDRTELSYVSGLAVMGDRLLLLDRKARKVRFIFLLEPGGRVQRTDQRPVKVRFEVRVVNRGPSPADVTVNVALPANYPNQVIRDIHPIGQWVGASKGEGPGRIARFVIRGLAPNKPVTVGYQVDAVLYRARWKVLPGTGFRPKGMGAFLRDADKYRIKSTVIQDIVRTCCLAERDLVTRARQVLHAVTARLHYELAGGWNPAPKVLTRGSGSCSEYTFAFVALARAVGIPARYVGALVFRGKGAAYDDVFHRWAEVFLPPYGWVPVDPNKADQSEPGRAAAGFGELGNNVLITTWSAGPSPGLGWDYDYHVDFNCAGQCDVVADAVAFFRDKD
jgi:transglutaminase-like putative cysteine protease